MPEPVSTTLLITAIAGTALSAYGQYKAGADQKAAFDYNAKVTEKETNQAEYDSRTRLRRLMSTQRSLYAKAGVDLSTGSPLLLLAETAGEGEREALSILEGGESSAALQRIAGRQAKTAGIIGAGSTLLTGIGTRGTNFFKKGRSPYIANRSQE